jgi:hypothetical protein
VPNQKRNEEFFALNFAIPVVAGVQFIDENGGGAGVRLRKAGDKGLKKAR